MTWKLLEIPQPWAENSSVAILSRTTWLWGGFFGGLWQTADEGATWTRGAGQRRGELARPAERLRGDQLLRAVLVARLERTLVPADEVVVSARRRHSQRTERHHALVGHPRLTAIAVSLPDLDAARDEQREPIRTTTLRPRATRRRGRSCPGPTPASIARAASACTRRTTATITSFTRRASTAVSGRSTCRDGQATCLAIFSQYIECQPPARCSVSASGNPS